MKKAALFIIMSSLALASQPGMAKDYGPGCGLGKFLVNGQSGMGPHVGAWFLNHVLLPQSFSQTSGILGCDTTTTVSNDIEKEEFVASNIDSLSVDMAKGEGEHLHVLASLMGIEEGDKGTFFELTQKNYSSIFSGSETDAGTVLSTLNAEMSMNTELAIYVQ